MRFVSIRIVTADVKRLVDFYQRVTGLEARGYTDDFAEVRTARATIAIAHERTMALFAAGAARPSANQSVIVELRADDVDAVHQRVGDWAGEIVQAPTTMPWGNRSLLLRDPDGNLVNLFTPVTPEALARAGD